MDEQVFIPVTLRRSLDVRTADLVSRWEANTAWRLDGGRYLKLKPLGDVVPLGAERDRLDWASDRLPVPRVLDYGIEEGVEWLLLEALPGRDATHPEHLGYPRRTVPLLAAGLRVFHETPAQDCPFDFRVDAALEHVRRRVEAEDVDPSGFHDVHAHLSPRDALAHLEATRPPTEDVVLCHGDYCFPNILIDAGMVVGYLDLGELGLADRWWDLAVATWSTTWNVGPGHEDLFLDAYGIAPDPDRIAFYRLLYDLAS